MELAHRMRRLGGEAAFVTFAAAQELERAGRHIVHLEIGQPDFPTPPHIVEAGQRALQNGETRYTPSAGMPELRDAVAIYLASTRNIQVTGSNVVITPGAKSALYSAMVAVINEGVDVLMPDPGFPAYASIASYLGAQPVFYGLDAQRNFTVTRASLEASLTPATRVLILNSPHNPTGGSIADSDLADIAALAVERDLIVISDEIYAELQYGDVPYRSIHALPGMAERTLVVDGFSKAYAMTGWRLGYLTAPGRHAEAIATLATNTFSCAAGFVQRAGIAALQGPQDCVREMRHAYAARASFVARELNAIPGVRCAEPRGAFYAFPDVRGVLAGRTAKQLADELLQEHGVALLPGTAFGSAGEGFLRLSYANSMENIAEGVRRLRDAVTLEARASA